MLFIKAWKFFLFVVVMSGFISHSLFNRLLSADLNKRRRYYVRTASFWSRQALKLVKFNVHYINLPTGDRQYLFVGNHLGLFDVLALASKAPALFITSIEMRNTPFLGFVSEMAGCMYVERRSRSNILGEMGEIRQALKDGFNVGLYPEGTSSDGQGVLPLKKTLMTAAAGTGVPIKPVVINFRKVNGEPMSPKWREHVCWYGDNTFVSSLFKIFELQSVDVDVEFCDEVMVHNEEERRTVAAAIQAVMIQKYTPIPLAPGEKSFFSPEVFAKA
jgi:1-acyl-sn-glycerol-3-phosphate acyltransferase